MLIWISFPGMNGPNTESLFFLDVRAQYWVVMAGRTHVYSTLLKIAIGPKRCTNYDQKTKSKLKADY